MNKSQKFLQKFRESSDPKAKFLMVGTPTERDAGRVLAGVKYPIVGYDPLENRYQVMCNTGKQWFVDQASVSSVSET